MQMVVVVIIVIVIVLGSFPVHTKRTLTSPPMTRNADFWAKMRRFIVNQAHGIPPKYDAYAQIICEITSAIYRDYSPTVIPNLEILTLSRELVVMILLL